MYTRVYILLSFSVVERALVVHIGCLSLSPTFLGLSRFGARISVQLPDVRCVRLFLPLSRDTALRMYVLSLYRAPPYTPVVYGDYLTCGVDARSKIVCAVLLALFIAPERDVLRFDRRYTGRVRRAIAIRLLCYLLTMRSLISLISLTHFLTHRRKIDRCADNIKEVLFFSSSLGTQCMHTTGAAVRRRTGGVKRYMYTFAFGLPG
jgi:hypothetical protein